MCKIYLSLFAIGYLCGLSFVAANDKPDNQSEYTKTCFFSITQWGSAIADKRLSGGQKGELKISREKCVEKGLVKWIYDNSNGYCLEIVMESSPVDGYSSTPISEDYILKDIESRNIPYKARVTMYRDGRDVPLEIEIIEGRSPDALHGSQHRRVLHLLNDMLLTNLQWQPLEQFQGPTMTIKYPENISYKEIGIREFKEEVYRILPTKLFVTYHWDKNSIDHLKLSYFIPSIDGSTECCTGEYVYDLKKNCVTEVSKVSYGPFTDSTKMTYQQFIDLLNNEKAEGMKSFRFVTIGDN